METFNKNFKDDIKNEKNMNVPQGPVINLVRPTGENVEMLCKELLTHYRSGFGTLLYLV